MYSCLWRWLWLTWMQTSQSAANWDSIKVISMRWNCIEEFPQHSIVRYLPAIRAVAVGSAERQLFKCALAVGLSLGISAGHYAEWLKPLRGTTSAAQKLQFLVPDNCQLNGAQTHSSFVRKRRAGEGGWDAKTAQLLWSAEQNMNKDYLNWEKTLKIVLNDSEGRNNFTNYEMKIRINTQPPCICSQLKEKFKDGRWDSLTALT